MNLVCQGAGGLGGQDWDGPHRVVGRLVLGHTAREDELRVGSTGHYQDIAWRRVSRLIGSDPTLISSNCDSVFEQCRSFHSLRATRVPCTSASEGRVSTELRSSAQPVSHRPAGACSTANIIPPSRLWAVRCGDSEAIASLTTTMYDPTRPSGDAPHPSWPQASPNTHTIWDIAHLGD